MSGEESNSDVQPGNTGSLSEFGYDEGDIFTDNLHDNRVTVDNQLFYDDIYHNDPRDDDSGRTSSSSEHHGTERADSMRTISSPSSSPGMLRGRRRRQRMEEDQTTCLHAGYECDCGPEIIPHYPYPTDGFF